MFSYWEQQSLMHYDHIVVGSGIVGLSTAISLREKKPGCRVLVLERGFLPAGASTRNAGFACIGSPTELVECLATMESAEVASLVEWRRRGLLGLRNRLGDQAIGYRENGSFELIPEHHLPVLDQIGTLNELLKPILGGDAFSVENDRIHDFGFDPSYTRALIRNHFEGELHAGMMMRALIDLALSRGVEIKTGCDVKSFEEEPGEVKVYFGETRNGEAPVFSARQLILCTNAFTETLVPGLDLKPGRGQVILTDPIPGLPFRGVYHFEKGFYYFRELQGRVLFGGGRQLDFTGETTTETGPNERILNDLVDKLKTIVIPGRNFRIASKWSGIMAFGQKPQPLLKRHSARVVFGVRLSGMGVAIGTELGRQLAELVLS